MRILRKNILTKADLTPAVIKRFWSYVEKTDDCRNYQAGISKGYGHILHKGIRYTATAFSWVLHGNTSEVKLLCHTCDNRRCVNPKHLFLGTVQDNARDMMKKGRGQGQFDKNTPTGFKKGYIPKSRKLTEETARAVKEDLKTMRQCDVIRKYNLPRDTIRGIVRSSSWDWI